jgi:GNAT superfamily N-acetyltransferase
MSKVKHLYDALEHVEEAAQHLFAEWPEMYMKLMNINTAEELANVLRVLYASPRTIPSGYVIVDELTNEFIGFASLSNNNHFKNHEFLNYRDFIWLTQLFIKPAYRKKGIASTFIDNMCDIAATHFDKANMVLWTHKKEMIPFYEKNQFELVESTKFENFEFEVLHRHTVKKEPIFKPVHAIGLVVVIVIIYTIKIILSFIKHLFTF